MPSDREDILALLRAYADLADTCRSREWAELFVPEGCFEVFGQRIEGRKKLERFIAKAATGRHGFDPAEIEIDGDRARASCPFRFVADDPERHSRGTYHDELVRRDGHWLFASRRVEFSARGPDALAEPAGGQGGPAQGRGPA